MFSSSTHRLSFEFFPPKTEAGRNKLVSTRDTLATLDPAFFSVTYGAGGSTRDNTKEIVIGGKRDGFSIAPHLSFGGDDETAMLDLINEYKEAGIDRIVALRGDLPSGSGQTRLVHANELVAFIRRHTGTHFQLEVAAYPEIHPEAISYDSDIQYLKAKFDAGADSALSQYFFNADAYCYFLDACHKAGIEKPIYPGIMPIINFDNLQRFSKNCGAEIPRWITKRIDALRNDDASYRAFTTDLVTELCEHLLNAGAPGLHFYTMNQTEPTLNICQRLFGK